MNLRFVFNRSALLLGTVLIAPLSSAQQVIKMSTITSTENSSLLTYLLPMFESKTNNKVLVPDAEGPYALRALVDIRPAPGMLTGYWCRT